MAYRPDRPTEAARPDRTRTGAPRHHRRCDLPPSRRAYPAPLQYCHLHLVAATAGGGERRACLSPAPPMEAGTVRQSYHPPTAPPGRQGGHQRIPIRTARRPPPTPHPRRPAPPRKWGCLATPPQWWRPRPRRKSPKAATAVATVRAAMGRQFAHHSCRVQVAAARRHHCDYRRRRCHRRCRRRGGRVTAAYAVWSAWSTAWSMAQPVQRYRYPVAVGAWSRPRRCPTLVGPHRRCRVATPAPALPVTLPCCRPRGRRWQRRPPPPLLHVRPPSVCPRGEGSAGGSAAAAPPSSHRRQRQERCHWRSHSPSRLPLRR